MASAEPDLAVDVLVIGAGGCGLVAALAAHEAGAEVAVVEKLPRLAGNTMLSSGSIPAAGTRFQVAASIADDPARFAADLRRTAGPHEAEALVDRLSEISAPMVEWLADTIGLPIELIGAYRHVGHSVNRLHAVPSRRGSDLMQGLWQAAEMRGIPVALATPATTLLVEDGAVRGARIQTQGSEESLIAAKAVILACNGFGHDRQLLARHAPDIAGAEYFGALGSDGEAVRWGEALGARLANMGAYQAHSAIAQPHGELVTWTVVEKGGVIVDESGRRFADETLGYSAFAAPALARGGRLFAIYDSRIREATAAGQPDFGVLVAHGGAPDFADAEALATACRLPADTLTETLALAAGAAKGDRPDALGRKAWGMGVLQAPFVATRIAPALFHTQGGLLVDEEARVLRADGGIVPGLYAGGGAAAGISGRAGGAGYASGNGLLAALGLGFIAGRAAAGQAQAT
ncbi:FAD-dependent oxidoreductase [Bosea sp. (in: a-proteobacteria)]|jgi:fumarate reductase flavoprotein subunit|uniref:FAD-dependent oxidoreductase n=1 Tax=Bosea sp. (in: a-proteobacteria) TaxID=1871050 RepID=UPI002DDD01E0|nr:FAD-dependent oxidoreductase [Bosea sp. (in: a-proteobacteria)]HEV2511966.1 FAD-dependent oxidoreductase [Bosea sp. (in: a-proteobacteria)]